MRLKKNLLPWRVFPFAPPVSSKETMAAIRTDTMIQTELAVAANAEIVAGLHRHDPDTIERLIELYQHRLFRYLLFLTGNRDVCWSVDLNTRDAPALKHGCLPSRAI